MPVHSQYRGSRSRKVDRLGKLVVGSKASMPYVEAILCRALLSKFSMDRKETLQALNSSVDFDRDFRCST